MSDVPSQSESAVEDRLTAYFGGGKPAAPQPVAQPQGESPAVADEALDAPIQAEDQSGQEQETQEQVSDEQPPEGFVELEHLGKRYFVEPDLKTAFEANRSAATRELQTVADVRRAIEMERQAVQTSKAFDAEVNPLVARAQQLASYKEQAKKLDWSSLTLDQKVDLDRELRGIDEELGRIGGEINQRRAGYQQLFGQFVVQSVSATEQYMAKRVNGWSPDAGTSLHDYGLQLGIPPEQLVSGWFANPTATHTMWKAQQWDRLQAGKPQVTNKALGAPPVARPGSNAVAQSQKASAYKQARGDLKKTGSLEAFASALLASGKR